MDTSRRRLNRLDRKIARKILGKAVELWEFEPGGVITEDRAVEKINGQIMMAGARMGLIQMAHWPEEGETWEENAEFYEASLDAFWERYGPHVQALLEN